MRSALVVAHTARSDITALAATATEYLREAGFGVRMLADEALECQIKGVEAVQPANAAEGVEIVIAFGGDGTFLRAAEFARPAAAPMLGVNLGHVGFLAEAEPQALQATIEAITDGRYTVDERTTIDVEVFLGDELIATNWALNEASVEKGSRERMLEVAVAVDSRPLLRFGCDGVLCATPTGSTAYAYSAGGPIMWPNVDAMAVVPAAAHALFARPIVVAPSSVVEVELLRRGHSGVLSCDGRRSELLPVGCRVRICQGERPVRIVRLSGWNFGELLVTKFQLPVRGFRDRVWPHVVDGAAVEPKPMT